MDMNLLLYKLVRTCCTTSQVTKDVYTCVFIAIGLIVENLHVPVCLLTEQGGMLTLLVNMQQFIHVVVLFTHTMGIY